MDFYPSQSTGGAKAEVGDPYRFLEDPESPATQAWVNSQNAITEEFLSECELRDKLKEKITEQWNYPKIGLLNK